MPPLCAVKCNFAPRALFPTRDRRSAEIGARKISMRMRVKLGQVQGLTFFLKKIFWYV